MSASVSGKGPRSPLRIDPFLRGLAEFWKQHPDWRFGQLIMNLSREPVSVLAAMHGERGFADIWEWDCSDFNRRMEQYEMDSTVRRSSE